MWRRTVRGEPLVEIETGRQVDELAQIGFGHFAFQHRRLEVEFVIRVASAELAGGRMASAVSAQQGTGATKERRNGSSAAG